METVLLATVHQQMKLMEVITSYLTSIIRHKSQTFLLDLISIFNSEKDRLRILKSTLVDILFVSNAMKSLMTYPLKRNQMILCLAIASLMNIEQ